MNYKECIKAKCEYLVKSVINKDYHCLDTNSPIENVDQCGIVDEVKDGKVK